MHMERSRNDWKGDKTGYKSEENQVNLQDNIVELGQNTVKSPGDLGGTCCHSGSSESEPANASVKHSQKYNNNNNNK